MNAPNYILVPNRKMGEAMVTAGIPFDKDQGPAINSYTPGFLRDRRIISAAGIGTYRFEQLVIETAERGARLAEMGKNENECTGSVTYVFERTKEAESFIAAWDAMAELIRGHREWEKLSDDEKAESTPPQAMPVISAEVVAKVLCMHANNLGLIAKLPYVNAPICNALGGKTKTNPERGGIYEEAKGGRGWGETTGAGKVWSTNLRDDDPDPNVCDRKKMGLHPKIRDCKGAK